MSRRFPASRRRGYVELERAARRFRQKTGVPPEQPVASVELFESLDRFSVRVGGTRIPVTYGVSELPPTVEGETHFDDGQIAVVLDSRTYSALRQEMPRARFSLVHEAGHALLHAPELVSLANRPDRRRALLRGDFVDISPIDDVEFQANGFAAAVLMPAPALKELQASGTLVDRWVAAQFGVSAESAGYRIQTFLKRRRDLLRCWEQPPETIH